MKEKEYKQTNKLPKAEKLPSKYGHGNKGRKQSKETRLKRSLSLKGKKRPKEVVDKISKSQKGRTKVWIDQEKYLWL